MLSRIPFARPPALAAAVVLATLLLLTAGLAPASAHTRLVGSVPAAGAEVPAAPAAVELQFNEPVQALGTQVLVTGPTGEVTPEAPVVVDGSVVRQELPTGLAAGAYTVLYRVVSGDGHPVEGELAFTTASGAQAPTSAGTSATTTAPRTTSSADPTADPTPASDQEASGTGLPWWAFVLLLLAAVAGALLALRLVRTRGAGDGDDGA